VAELEIKDIPVIGGGPTGLFAAFYAGMRGASACIIDALRRVEDDGVGYFVLQTSEADYASRTIVIAPGIGAFEARRLGIEDEDRFEKKGLHFKVLDPRQFEGKRVPLVGGGDSAFDWAVNLQGVAQWVILIQARRLPGPPCDDQSGAGVAPGRPLRAADLLGGKVAAREREGRGGDDPQQQDEGGRDLRRRRRDPAARLPLRPRRDQGVGLDTEKADIRVSQR
jgi:cation diffusion facilitator CzcD-associated flavoprotein CzcO